MAIARDGSATTGSNNTTALTLTGVTCNGPNPMLWVGAVVDSSETLTATYNGVAMVNPTNAVRIDTGIRLYLFGLSGVTGTHDVVISTSGGAANISAAAQPFSGASQTQCVSGSQPDASGNAIDGASASEFTITLTTTIANDWIVALDHDFSGGNSTPTAPAATDAMIGTNTLFSQGPYASTGSNSIKATPPGFDFNGHVYAAFSPATSSGPTLPWLPVTKVVQGRTFDAIPSGFIPPR